MSPDPIPSPQVVALAGGVGGAKLVAGLAACLPDRALTVVVNTGDDFEHLGLTICPDLDTVTYTLAGLANPQTGWGRREETWHFLQTLEQLEGPAWFRLGDRDLALHVERTRRLQSGQTLSQVCEHLSRVLGIGPRILPMSDHPIRTIVGTTEGELAFQDYFVARACEPQVSGFRFAGAERAEPAPGVLESLAVADLVVLCPSNPWVSLDPILAVPGMRPAVSSRPVVGVSPIVAGAAVKGPAAKMFRELGIQPSARAVAEHYRDLLDGWILDRQDADQADEIESLGMRTLVTNTIMRSDEDRRQLASQVLALAETMGVVA